jgi:hypothetical protein
MYLAERLLIKKKKNFRGRLYSAFTRNLVTLILKSNLDVDFFFFLSGPYLDVDYKVHFDDSGCS